jgi:hypothetical protein
MKKQMKQVSLYFVQSRETWGPFPDSLAALRHAQALGYDTGRDVEVREFVAGEAREVPVSIFFGAKPDEIEKA